MNEKTDQYCQRLRRGLGGFLLVVISIYVCNAILPAIDFSTMSWRFPVILPLGHPVGIDFKTGVYDIGVLLWNGKSPYIYGQSYVYPPLPAVIGMFFALLPYATAYFIQMLVLFALNIGTLWLAVQIMSTVYRQGIKMSDDAFCLVLFCLLALVLFMDIASYGFAFSVERGNIDIYAQFFSVLGLWLLVKKPDRLWWLVLALSVAVHCKIYPLILFFIVFWRYRWKCLIPIAVINTLLLLVLGPANLLQFISKQCQYVQSPYLWIGNHSALSFTQMVLVPMGVSLRLGHVMSVGLPVGMWLVGTLLLWKRGYDAMSAVLLFALSVPLMSVLPSTSHDYKLVILYAPCLMLLAGLLLNYIREGGWQPLLMIGILLTAMGFMSRSFYLVSTVYLQNKYPFILLIQGIALAVIVWPGSVFRMAPVAPSGDKISGKLN